jgi:ABC-type amino acid transport substrate-binding protein
MEYRGNDGVLRGFEVDLLREVAGELDLRPVWIDTRRTALVGAVLARKCDVIASSFPVRWEYQQSIRQVEYLGVPISLLVRDDDDPPLAIGLCGRAIGAFARTRESELLVEYSKVCRRHGRPPVKRVAMTDTPDALRQLQSGSIDGLLDERPSVAWYSRLQTDRFDDGGGLPDEQVDYSIGYGAGRNSVFWGIRSALQTLHSDGRFRDLLHRWGLDRNGVEGLPLYS